MFDHWLVDEKLKELGWKRKEILWFKEGMSDSIIGNFREDYMTYDLKREVKLKPNHRERAYMHGHRSGEEYIKIWVGDMNFMRDFISGD